jgi:ParB/RepB/Spo0J family partition protein
MPNTEIQLVDPAEAAPSDDADPAMRPDIDFLMESIRQDDQQVPVLLAPHPASNGAFKYQTIDGHGRRYCLLRLNRKMRAIVLDKPVPEAERIELLFACNDIRRHLSMAEVATNAIRHMELNGCTQQETAVRLKCSNTKISRAIAVIRRIPAECRAEAYKLGDFFVGLILPLRDAEAMKQAIAFASTPRADGKRPTREQVKDFVTKLRRGKRPQPAKPKRMKLRVDDRRFEIELKPDDSPETLIEALKAAVGKLQKHRELSLHAVAAVLADKEPTAA